MLNIFKRGFKKTREKIKQGLSSVISGKCKVIDSDAVEEIEECLLETDIGVQTVLEIVEDLKNTKFEAKDLAKNALDKIKTDIENSLNNDYSLNYNNDGLTVVLVVGVNGSGKTTTIAKIANQLLKDGKKVILSACDTFRAAAIDQLQIWADRLKIGLVKHNYGADAGAVAFDSLEAAISRKADYLIIDTAGRLHTNKNLMEELKKIKRILERRIPGAPQETLLVLDGTTGQNALVQARAFKEDLGITGIVLTKLDGTAKGGIVVSIQKEMGIPVKYVGLGEGMDDLQVFNPHEFAEALLGNTD
ncbi:signal recognition particle-docking protein FtsY [Chlamydiota bacterium]